MVMLKILQQYYNATGDERVITALTKYFKFQLKELPNRPLDHDTFWANRRGGDNLQVVYWLYNITGDNYLMKLGEIITEQTFPWTDVFLIIVFTTLIMGSGFLLVVVLENVSGVLSQ